jgi:hypothetical protein
LQSKGASGLCRADARQKDAARRRASVAHRLQPYQLKRVTTKVETMSVQNEILAKEQSLWSGGALEYRRALDGDCLIAFVEMAGVQSRDQIAEMAGKGERWQDVDIEVEGLLEPTKDVTILTYRVSAVKGNAGEPYKARVSSGYVKRDGDWRMMFHQQTPLTDA